MAKVVRKVKAKIVRLYTGGLTVGQVKAALREGYPKITTDCIHSILRKWFIVRADELWAVAVKRVGHCEISLKTGNLEAHHLIGRDNYLFRWDLKNGVCLSSYHHRFAPDMAAHGSTEATAAFAIWMEEYKPEQWQWYLEHKDCQDICKPTIDDLVHICKELDTTINPRKETRCERKNADKPVSGE